MAIDLVNVAAGVGGFVIHGQDANDVPDCSVSSAGDVNGDGFDDVIIGAPSADGPGNTRPAGDSYVVFGKASGFAAEIDLAAVAAGNGGFVIHGQDAAIRPAIRYPRPATSTATASTTSSSGLWSATAPATPATRRATATWCSARPRCFAAEIDLAAVAAGNGGFVIHGQDGATIYPAGRCPRPATSTATASTT